MITINTTNAKELIHDSNTVNIAKEVISRMNNNHKTYMSILDYYLSDINNDDLYGKYGIKSRKREVSNNILSYTDLTLDTFDSYLNHISRFNSIIFGRKSDS